MPPRVNVIRIAALLGIAFTALAASLSVPRDEGTTRAATVRPAHPPSASTAMRAGATPVAMGRVVSPAMLPFSDQPTVEPPLPKTSLKPCEVEILDDSMTMGFGSYTPPAACPGPWAKVLLRLDLSGPRDHTNAVYTLSLDGITLFWGAPQIHDGVSNWRLERDVTDYAAWLQTDRSVETHGTGDDAGPNDDEPAIHGIATLEFYPATSAEPAQAVPDAIVPAGDAMSLPRNIERAYLDLYAQPLDTGEDAARFWYACVDDFYAAGYPAFRSPYAIGDNYLAIFSTNPQGCRGGSFREVQVTLDGTYVGLAPVVPWVPSRINLRFPDAVDAPAPSVQALNAMPMRLDLTPYAARLNDGLPHSLRIAVAGASVDLPYAAAGQLLLYLDAGSKIVTGGVVANTLDPAFYVTSPTLTPSADSLAATITTSADRDYRIAGFVNTSHGRIDSDLRDTLHFRNVQQFLLDGLTYPNWRSYRQKIQLTSTVDRISRRRIGSLVVNDDREHREFPLALDYTGRGRIFDTDEGPRSSLDYASINLQQDRQLKTNRTRPGFRYTTTLRDQFKGTHVRDFSASLDSRWASTRQFAFGDNRGNCYGASLTTANGVLASSALGGGCTGGVNILAWYVHPDGSPDALGWGPVVP
jgi:hypothetical protein